MGAESASLVLVRWQEGRMSLADVVVEALDVHRVSLAVAYSHLPCHSPSLYEENGSSVGAGVAAAKGGGGGGGGGGQRTGFEAVRVLAQEHVQASCFPAQSPRVRL